MIMRPQSRFLGAMLISLAASTPAVAQSAQPARSRTVETAAAPPAARMKLSGLPYLAAVSSQLYRGAQPDDNGFAELKKLGVGIVVNLRHEPNEIARERSLVESRGMQYVSIPWRGKQDPKPEQVARFLSLLWENPDKKVFVHCERGAERTGVMVASYRISRDHWTSAQALDEMEAFRFRGMRFQHLKKFVREFPALLLTDPFLKRIGQVTSSSGQN
jgi:protein tyrosine/serine phosphatase